MLGFCCLSPRYIFGKKENRPKVAPCSVFPPDCKYSRFSLLFQCCFLRYEQLFSAMRKVVRRHGVFPLGFSEYVSPRYSSAVSRLGELAAGWIGRKKYLFISITYKARSSTSALRIL